MVLRANPDAGRTPVGCRLGAGRAPSGAGRVPVGAYGVDKSDFNPRSLYIKHVISSAMMISDMY